MTTNRISDIPVHNTAPGGTSKIEIENPTGPTSEYTTAAELLAANTTARNIVNGVPSASGGTAAGYGVPNTHPHSAAASSPITARRIFYTPFIVTKTIHVTNILFRTGASLANTPNLLAGIYNWDEANAKPGALLGSVSQATGAINTIYDKTLSPALDLTPGVYATAFLNDAASGSQTVFVFTMSTFMALNHYVTNTLLHPAVFGSTTGQTSLPNPNTDTMTAFNNLNSGAEDGSVSSLLYPCVLGFSFL